MKLCQRLLSLLLILPLLGYAEQPAIDINSDQNDTTIYRSKDSRGNPVFSDQPSRDAEQAQPKEVNRTPAVTPQARPDKPKPEDVEDSDYRITFLEPTDGQFFANGLVPVNVSINVSPPVLPKHRIEFLLNGESIAQGSSYSTTIDRLHPGAHQIGARVIDKAGNILGNPGSIDVTAQWPGGR